MQDYHNKTSKDFVLFSGETRILFQDEEAGDYVVMIKNTNFYTNLLSSCSKSHKYVKFIKIIIILNTST